MGNFENLTKSKWFWIWILMMASMMAEFSRDPSDTKTLSSASKAWRKGRVSQGQVGAGASGTSAANNFSREEARSKPKANGAGAKHQETDQKLSTEKINLSKDPGLQNREPSAASETEKSSPLVESASSFLSQSEIPVEVHRGTTGRPFRIIGEWELGEKAHQLRSTENYKAFLFRASQALEIDHPEQLEYQASVAGAHTFIQTVHGIPVEGGLVRVFTDRHGAVTLINSSFVPKVADTLPEPVVAKEMAFHLVENHALKYETSTSDGPSLNQPRLVVRVPQANSTSGDSESSEPRLQWRISVVQPSLGSQHGASVYFVDALNGRIERVERALQ